MLTRKAFALKDPNVLSFHNEISWDEINIEEYIDYFRRWTKMPFDYPGYITDGVTGAYYNFEEEFPDLQTTVLRGEYPFHRDRGINVIEHYSELRPGMKLIISYPFAGDGNIHTDWNQIVSLCQDYSIPIFVDQAFMGLHNKPLLHSDAFTYIAYSFSKMFGTGFCRTGICFKNTQGITSMNLTNQYGYINRVSANLNMKLMENFEYDYVYKKYASKQKSLCKRYNIEASDTILFGVGSDKEFKRDILYNRVCISKLLVR